MLLKIFTITEYAMKNFKSKSSVHDFGQKTFNCILLTFKETQ